MIVRCTSVMDAKIILYKNNIKVDNCYRSILGFPNSLGMHVYFNQYNSTKAYYTPMYNTLTIYDKPRFDDTPEHLKSYVDKNIRFD